MNKLPVIPIAVLLISLIVFLFATNRNNMQTLEMDTSSEVASDGVGVATGSSDSGTSDAVRLTARTWVWKETALNDDSKAVPNEFGDTQITFDDSGKVFLDTDCNYMSGTYETDDTALSIDITVSTKMACLGDSTQDTIFKHLNQAQSYMFEDGDLFIALKLDSGVIQFSELMN